MFRVTHLVLETAIMDYGPAFQLTLGSIHLVDKYHHSPSGEYLELISSPVIGCVATILYRKIRANCPEFKSQFHFCEQSLVINLATINLVWHRGAVITLMNYLTLLLSKLGHLQHQVPYNRLKTGFINWMQSGPEDPPVPSGATKWSISTHLNTLNIKLCDNEVDFVQGKVRSLHTECVFKANEKKIFRATLSELTIDDMSEFTLHSRMVEIEEDKVFDIKIVEFSPSVELDANDPKLLCKPDTSLRIRVGRVQCIFLWKFIADLQRFLEPILCKENAQIAARNVEKAAQTELDNFFSNRKIDLSIDIHAPTILIPQKSDSPSLLVVHIGDLKIENLFKISSNIPNTSFGGPPVLENILIELGPVQMCRAVVTHSGGLEMQESILEPATIRADLKRALVRQCREVLSWDVSVRLGSLNINLGQRDLNTILSVLTQNKLEAQFIDTSNHSRPLTPVDLGTPVVINDDNVGKLQAFLTHSVDIYKVAEACVSLDSLTLTLYTDMDEVLSSPVRDAATALCCLSVGEVDLRGDMNNDKSLDMRLTLHSCNLFDVRADNPYVIKKIFGMNNSDVPADYSGFSFNVPHMLDLVYKISPNGDSAIEICLEKTRFNVSVGFGLAFFKCINEAIPSSSNSAGILNPGFVGDGIGAAVDGVRIVKRPPSSADSTSGYLSTVTSNNDEQKVISLSLRIKRPEILLFIEPEDPFSKVLVTRCELQFDYSRHPGSEGFHVSLDDLHVFTATYSTQDQNPYGIVQPCSIEGSWSLQAVEDGERAFLNSTHLHVNLNPSVMHMLTNIMEELIESLSPPSLPFELELPSAEMEDLWTPKALTATISPTNLEEEKYVKPDYPSGKPEQQLICNIPLITISFEKYMNKTTVPVILLKSNIEGEINNWSKSLYTKVEIQLEMMCFNEEFSTWEPLIEPVIDECSCTKKPWEVMIKTLRLPAQMIGTKKKLANPSHLDTVDSLSHHSKRNSYISTIPNDSDSSSEEEEAYDNEMLILKANSGCNPRRSLGEGTGIPGYPLDSDSETEDGLLYKISSAFSHMFSSDSEESDQEEGGEGASPHHSVESSRLSRVERRDSNSLSSARSSQGTPEDEHASQLTINQLQDTADYNHDDCNIFVPNNSAGIDPTGIEEESCEMANYIFIDSRDRMEISITPRILEAITNLFSSYVIKPSGMENYITPKNKSSREIKVHNEIGSNTKITVFAVDETIKGEKSKEVKLAWSKYKEVDSLPSSPESIKGRSRGASASEDELENDG